MSGQKNDSGDRTEKPTSKRLRDARKDGDVHKSTELSSTMIVLVWLLAVWLLIPAYYRTLEGLFGSMFEAITRPGPLALNQALEQGGTVLVMLTVPVMFVAAVVGLFTDYIQVGSVFAPKKVKPDISRLNPTEGIKKMFSKDNLVELIKSIMKTAAMTGIFIVVLWSLLPQFIQLPLGQVGDIASAHWQGLFRMCAWTIFVFFFVSALDAFWQRHSFIKRLQMSRRDIRQESKESEGDPHIKGRRRQLHQEWAQQNVLHSVRKSSVVVTNPTHVAVALLYEAGQTDLPVVVAKGEDHEAAMIRAAAEEAGIPIMQNVALARGLNEKIEVDDYITGEFFQAVAEVLRWAESVRADRDGR